MVPKLQTAAPVASASCCSLLQPPGTVRRWSCTRINTRSTVPHALVLGTVPAQSGAAHLCRARGHLASLSMVFHALRPLCRQTPVEGGTPVKLLRFLPLLLLLCGCAREVSPVSALALDCKNGVYCLTAEVVRQDSPDDTAAPAYLVRNRNRCDGRTAQPAQYPAGRPVFEPCTGAAFKRGCGFREHSSAGGLSLP